MIDKSRRMCYSDIKSGELVKQAERKSSNFDPFYLMRVMPP